MAVEEEILKFLFEDWRKRYRTTNIRQAAERLGLPYSNDTRMRIASHLKSIYQRNAVPVKRLKECGLLTFILTNQEKLIVRCILYHWKCFHAFPNKKKIAQTLDLTKEEVDAGLHVLNWIGFITKHKSSGSFIYRLAEDFEKFLRGLGFTFHTVALESGEKFNVECSADALILATSMYANQKVIIKDSCYHCLERLSIVVIEGKLVEQNPEGIRIYEGKG